MSTKRTAEKLKGVRENFQIFIFESFFKSELA